MRAIMTTRIVGNEKGKKIASRGASGLDRIGWDRVAGRDGRPYGSSACGTCLRSAVLHSLSLCESMHCSRIGSGGFLV